MPIRNSSSKRKCKPIAINKKERLINLVVDKDKSVHKASKMIGIKYSTAKAIVKRYKDTGVLSARVKNIQEPTINVKQEASLQSEPSQNHSNSAEYNRQIPYYPYYQSYGYHSEQPVPWPSYHPYPYGSPYFPIPPYTNPFWRY